MIPRYTHPEMGRIWSDQRRYETWLLVETAAAEAMAVAEKVGPSARWLHFGMTSSDVIDTAQALQMREACDVILKDLDVLSEVIRERAFEHRNTEMIGRTHGVHAEPMTFGLKLALWHAELARA